LAYLLVKQAILALFSICSQMDPSIQVEGNEVSPDNTWVSRTWL